MPAISQAELVAADVTVRRMGIEQRVQLADEIYANQPQLLASVLVLPRYGATMAQLDVPIDILLVFYQAMKSSQRRWPVISEDIQERSLKRVVARVRFIEDLPSDLKAVAVKDALDDHPEKPMLAFVFGRMKRMLGIETEAEMMMVLAALNLVECIGTAVVAPDQR